ncbi:MAG: hypothetical protein ACRDYA_03595 [Egibacteraceae bacterium]
MSRHTRHTAPDPTHPAALPWSGTQATDFGRAAAVAAPRIGPAATLGLATLIAELIAWPSGDLRRS